MYNQELWANSTQRRGHLPEHAYVYNEHVASTGCPARTSADVQTGGLGCVISPLDKWLEATWERVMQ